ncbi:MAG: polyprenyl synthetase family protein [Peptoniphilus sp.]|nr:polyprenyl synthetase family protein [Peptoniphilus sp.]
MIENNNLISVIDNYLYTNFAVVDEYQKKVYESMNYSLYSGGKRIRPILCILSYSVMSDGADIEKILPYAAAIEMIHTYSLIHDDLPAMDDDDLRRGKPTNHKVFPEAIAILAGDGLLNTAAELLSKNLENYDDMEELKRAIKAMRYIFNASGTGGLIGGQVIDLEENKDMTLDLFENMYKLKTAALIRAAIVSGGIMAGAYDEELASLEEFANCIGIAYQIKDDLIDGEQDKDKNTILKYSTKEELLKRIEDLTRRGKEELKSIDHNTESLENYADFLMNRSV